jgi:hypothetical protein
MSKVTITRVYRGEQQTKKGLLPKIGIKTTAHGDKWLSSFQVPGTESWKEGDEVDIDIEENGQYLNFRQIDRGDKAVKTETSLEERVKWLENRVSDIEKYLKTKQEKEAVAEFNNI